MFVYFSVLATFPWLFLQSRRVFMCVLVCISSDYLLRGQFARISQQSRSCLGMCVCASVYITCQKKRIGLPSVCGVCVFFVVACAKIDWKKYTGVFTEGNVLANSENAYDFTGRISVGSEVE